MEELCLLWEKTERLKKTEKEFYKLCTLEKPAPYIKNPPCEGNLEDQMCPQLSRQILKAKNPNPPPYGVYLETKERSSLHSLQANKAKDVFQTGQRKHFQCDTKRSESQQKESLKAKDAGGLVG